MALAEINLDNGNEFCINPKVQLGQRTAQESLAKEKYLRDVALVR